MKNRNMKAFNPNENINDVGEFEDVANEMWEAYLQTFTEERGLIRPATEDDWVDEDNKYVYTRKGDRLATKMRDKLIEIGQAHFPDEEIELSTYMYQ